MKYPGILSLPLFNEGLVRNMKTHGVKYDRAIHLVLEVHKVADGSDFAHELTVMVGRVFWEG